MDFTTLFFSQSLTDVYGNTFPSGKSDWADNPGFINFKGSDSISYTGSSQTFRAWVIANATKGSNLLTVSNVTGLTPGLRVRVTASDPLTGKLMGCCWNKVDYALGNVYMAMLSKRQVV